MTIPSAVIFFPKRQRLDVLVYAQAAHLVDGGYIGNVSVGNPTCYDTAAFLCDCADIVLDAMKRFRHEPVFVQSAYSHAQEVILRKTYWQILVSGGADEWAFDRIGDRRNNGFVVSSQISSTRLSKRLVKWLR